MDTHKETLDFQAEAKQLLSLMVHSLYSDKEIFLRELISNASDACDKLRFEALSDDALYEDDSELQITVDFDKDARTLTLTDNGIGMNRQEVTDNIGIIAKSGTKKFFESLTGDQAKDTNLIGQFGVGFYSTFIIADKVTLETRRAGLTSGHGVRWESSGEGSFSLETIEKASRGTSVTLHLREGEDEFLEYFRLNSIIKKYSDHINLPILMKSQQEDKQDEYETVNQASALWVRSRKEISDDEYKEFYKHVAHDFEDPQSWLHNQVEGTQSYITLFYIPKRAPFDLWDRDKRHGVKLYVKRVFIMDDAEQLIPGYLRFVRGLVDSDDLPLNISREILQNNKIVSTIKAGSVKKILAHLAKMAKDDKEQYAEFWKNFGAVLKEGPAEDFANRDAILKLMRFSSTQSDSETPDVSIEDYIGRMKEGQDSIYFVTADSFAAAKNSPHLEVFRKKGLEVLLMHERVDEWMMSHMQDFDGRKFQSVAKGELDLGDMSDKEEEKKARETEKEFKAITERMKKSLGERVKDVRVSHRLTTSPACLVVEEGDMNVSLQNMLKQAGHDVPNLNPSLEINPEHPIIVKIKDESDETRFNDWSSILFDQAMLSEGGQLKDPASYVNRLNGMLLHFMQ
ncbi:MAG TPA: molecular chaperone HtpG [Gammaproteobacteria bacterium]|nr:molecular chaperone HtpG [Gammaproteobacteria bacterium]